MTDEQDALDTAARAVSGVQDELARAAKWTRPENHQAKEHIEQAEAHAATALGLLINTLGARRPGLQVARDTLPLELLSTPATRALVEALELATRAAVTVDVERGWIDEDGEAIGFGETLGGILLGLRREVYGAKGRGLE